MGKYNDIWKAELPFIKKAIQAGSDSRKLDETKFTTAGDRASSGYSFRLDIENANVPTKSGSAVARDLKKELDEDTEFKKLAQGKRIINRMGKDFHLEIQAE